MTSSFFLAIIHMKVAPSVNDGLHYWSPVFQFSQAMIQCRYMLRFEIGYFQIYVFIYENVG
jgi:hypothetical protein